MLEIFKMYFFPCLINMITVIYLQSIMLNKKVDFRDKVTYISLFTLVLASILNYIYIDNHIRVFTSTIFMTVIMCFTFRTSMYKAFGVVVMQQIILFISELIYALVLTLLKTDIALLSGIVQGTLFTNVVISLIAIVLVHIKYIRKAYERILRYIFQINEINNYFLLLFFLLSLNVLLVFMYFSSTNKAVVIINLTFMLVYAIILYFLINEKWENIRFRNENKLLIGNLNEYEKMLDYQRVNNHENKNQLLVIKGLLHKNNTKAHDYIDEIIKEKREDNETLYTKAQLIPSGGLQGLIYQKMLVMQENNIRVDLSISRDIKKINYSKISSKMNYDICRIVGIFLDNAIDETKTIDEKEIVISIYVEEGLLNIEISNYLKNDLDINKIYEKGYTTKEKGHGYGLTLAKEIISKNENISNENSIVKNIFTQIIKIKM